MNTTARPWWNSYLNTMLCLGWVYQKRCFLPSAEPCAEHGSVLQMAATAARVVKAAESTALVFQKRLMTRDAGYFIGTFQQLSPWAVFLHLFVYRKMMHYSKFSIRTKCWHKKWKNHQLSDIWCLFFFKCSLYRWISKHFLDILHRLSKSKISSGILPETSYHLKKRQHQLESQCCLSQKYSAW